MKSTTYDDFAMSKETVNNIVDIDNPCFLYIPFHKESDQLHFEVRASQFSATLSSKT
jgi:hypothetical protein